jgi:hypothetical protein
MRILLIAQIRPAGSVLSVSICVHLWFKSLLNPYRRGIQVYFDHRCTRMDTDKTSFVVDH